MRDHATVALRARLWAPIRPRSPLYLTSCLLPDAKRPFEFPIRSAIEGLQDRRIAGRHAGLELPGGIRGALGMRKVRREDQQFGPDVFDFTGLEIGAIWRGVAWW